MQPLKANKSNLKTLSKNLLNNNYKKISRTISQFCLDHCVPLLFYWVRFIVLNMLKVKGSHLNILKWHLNPKRIVHIFPPYL